MEIMCKEVAVACNALYYCILEQLRIAYKTLQSVAGISPGILTPPEYISEMSPLDPTCSEPPPPPVVAAVAMTMVVVVVVVVVVVAVVIVIVKTIHCSTALLVLSI